MSGYLIVTVPPRCVQLEEERDRLEGDKLELAGARHQLEAEYKEQLASLEPSLLASTF